MTPLPHAAAWRSHVALLRLVPVLWGACCASCLRKAGKMVPCMSSVRRSQRHAHVCQLLWAACAELPEDAVSKGHCCCSGLCVRIQQQRGQQSAEGRPCRRAQQVIGCVGVREQGL